MLCVTYFTIARQATGLQQKAAHAIVVDQTSDIRGKGSVIIVQITCSHQVALAGSCSKFSVYAFICSTYMCVRAQSLSILTPCVLIHDTSEQHEPFMDTPATLSLLALLSLTLTHVGTVRVDCIASFLRPNRQMQNC